MHLGRIRIDGTLTVQSPLHIGSGGFVEKPRDKDHKVQINAILRDVGGKPYIPGTTLKGVLRAVQDKGEGTNNLFGMLDPADHNECRMGRLWFHGATLTSALEPTEVKAQTRIDRETGAAEATKLFHSERVPAGATFAFSAVLHSDSVAEVPDGEVDGLVKALGLLTIDGGVTLGRGGRQGQGRVRLDGIKALHERFDIDSGAWVAGDASVTTRLGDALAKAAAPERETITLRLVCEGPYLTIDSSERPEHKDGEVDRIRLLLADGTPVLWASSLLGALRQRAAWLMELDRLRKPEDAGRAENRPMDDRDPDKPIRSMKEVEALTPVERLFGVAGYRGRLSVEDLTWTGASKELSAITSVSIDRFTGGARDGALFTTEVVYGAAFEVTLRVDASGPDRDFLDRLIKNLTKEDLFLGAGASKGFGWFTVEQEEVA